jgi:hypothetical protein
MIEILAHGAGVAIKFFPLFFRSWDLDTSIWFLFLLFLLIV